LVACLILVAGASIAHDWTRSGVFSSDLKQAKERVSGRPADSRSAVSTLRPQTQPSDKPEVNDAPGLFKTGASARASFASAYQ
jgi:hypothetical protein